MIGQLVYVGLLGHSSPQYRANSGLMISQEIKIWQDSFWPICLFGLEFLSLDLALSLLLKRYSGSGSTVLTLPESSGREKTDCIVFILENDIHPSSFNINKKEKTQIL